MATPDHDDVGGLSDELRREFYDYLLSQSQTTPATDFRRLADAWLKATGATWVWLWLKNPFLEETPWELREISCKGTNRSRYVPENVLVPDPRPVAEYCIRTATPEYIDDPPSWRRQLGTEEFTVACWDSLRRMGCQSFLTVPFRSPSATGNDSKSSLRNPIEGVVCSHFDSKSDYVKHHLESQILMARLTALTVVNSFQKFQQEILLELNTLAQSVLSFISRRSVDDRKKYIEAIIDLLKRHLSVSAVSIFYQEDDLSDEVTCLATTGLADNSSNPFSPSEALRVRYRIGEGLTGKVFRDGVPEVLSHRSASHHQPTTVEHIDGRIVGESDAVIFPIPRPQQNVGKSTTTAKARGVIRCCDRRSHLSSDQNRPFDPVDMETLDFIARQIAPILETLTVRVLREETISMIKHDLYNPLGMIRDTVESIEKNIRVTDVWTRVRTFDILNIGASALFASNLAQQLDPQPAQDLKPEFQRTLLEKSIVARNKNMLSHYAFRENGMTIYFDGFRDIPVLWVDRDLIERAIVNLLTNAIKYGEEGTRISVLAHVEDDGFHIDVSNMGQGIAAENEHRVFEPRFRSSAPHVQMKMGLGLGLYIARKAIEDHGGRLVLSSLQSPTTFTIILPEELKRGPLHV